MTESTEPLSAREQRLTEQNERLGDALREARDQLTEGMAMLDGAAKREVVGDALDYVVIAIELRRGEIARAIKRNVVGEDADDARRITGAAFVDILDAALLIGGFEIRPVPS